MTLDNIKKLPVYQTRSIATAAEDPDTMKYIFNCLAKLYAGNYGEIPAEDTDANNKELKAGAGRIVARYKAAANLESDIYIISEFCAEDPDNQEANHTTILYCNEY